MRKQSVNLWAVLVCVVIGQFIPALWHASFSELWTQLNGFTAEQIKLATGPAPYLARIVSTSFMAYTMAWVFTRMHVKTLLNGFLIGLLFGTVFVFSEIIVKDMFSLRPLLLSFIEGGSSIAVYAITGSILGVWRTYN